ncbi:class I SAM-dependent methyltransferase [Opitutaceae bacterium EW11]|nr:class I SAM-dependent methyltransferase [Opitutaceae bacterium EW11]
MENGDPNRLWQDSVHALGERSNYKRIWNDQAAHPEVAKLAVAGYREEAGFEATAADTIATLRATTGISPYDIALEIGCGVGRVGKHLATQCYHWIGTDISGEMLRHASQRLQGLSNVTLLELHTVGLSEIYSGTMDLVYCTIVFMHLFEWDRYRYVQEMARVLRPGGRCYFDNIPLDSAHGWQVFSEGAAYPIHRRPAHMSMSSSREEFRSYLTHAGFEDIRIHDLPSGLIAGTGRKPY